MVRHLLHIWNLYDLLEADPVLQTYSDAGTDLTEEIPIVPNRSNPIVSAILSV